MIKVSDYIYQFLGQKNVKHVFMLPGGGAMHLVDSLGASGIEYTCCGHEQAVAIAAESYGQHTNTIGVGVVTSGPGSTNSITGVTAGWIDSTPMMMISGQAKRSDLMHNTGVRQMGSQEVDIIRMVQGITKYAVQVLEPMEIRYHLEKAYYLAGNGRKGPVWLDIPLDVQSTMIDENELKGFIETIEVSDMSSVKEESIQNLISMIQSSKKPLVLAGNGVKLSEGEGELFDFIKLLSLPVLTTWKTIDMFDENDPHYVGHPGIMGDRGANIILQNCDLLIVLGSRLDPSLTAYNDSDFARNAKVVMVDIDTHEINKLKRNLELVCICDTKTFLGQLIKSIPLHMKDIEAHKELFSQWLLEAHKIRRQFPVVTEEHKKQSDFVSTYYFIQLLCDQLTEQDVIVPESSGGAGEITYQAFQVKKGQKIKNAAGLGSMGFGLPYSIGACLANDRRQTILINGDGAFHLNIQELETIKRLNLPIKMFILNNDGYASIKSMQNNLFEGHHVACDGQSGLTLPDFKKIAGAYGIKSVSVKTNNALESTIDSVLNESGPILCELFTDPKETVSPRVKTVKMEDGTLVSGKLDNMWPFLS